nr:UdgX family uracil-DNA binding protein [Ameyamaea chiangmaiensis]
MPERGTFEAWRRAARLALSHSIAPERIDWTGGGGLFAGASLPGTAGERPVTVIPAFPALARTVMWHASPQRFALLYQALWRLAHREAALSAADPLGRQLDLMARSVRRDIHKMHAFVRFREVPSDTSRRRFAAWFEPDHYTLEPGCGLFARRFADMDWLIATPYLTARSEAGALRFHSGGTRPDLPPDASESLWATYFANIFNPARIKLSAMRSEMPRKYWKNLPETQLIPDMLADAEARVKRMRDAGASTPNPASAAISTRYRATMPRPADVPESLADARAAALQCRRCTLCEAATQTVWGTGDPDAAMMIVGEQPGDREDLVGQPFVGPAGDVLREALREAAVDADRIWMTNAVKHFKFTPRGTQRLHQSPDRGEIQHCRWWLGLELAFVRPRVTLALGASAAFALTDDHTALAPRRGHVETGLHGGPVVLSWHPSYILRLSSPTARDTAQRALVADIRAAVAKANQPPEA